MKKQVLVALLFILCLTAYGEEPLKDLDHKANFVIDLMEKIKWPAGKSDSGTYVISILGKAPISASLENAAKGSGGKITVRTVTLQDDLSGDNVLFIASDDLGLLAKALKKVDGKNVFTVSDQKDFARTSSFSGSSTTAESVRKVANISSTFKTSRLSQGGFWRKWFNL